MGLRGLKSEFAKIQKAYEKNDKTRDQIIIESRSILKFSKQAIYALHRDDVKSATKLLAQAKKIISKCDSVLKKYSGKEVGSFNAALEEYVEAECYLSYITTKNFPKAKDLQVHPNVYLLGLCDCTGELARRAVNLAIKGDVKAIEHIHTSLEELTELFLQIEFRGIDMRKKLEGLKYNVTKTQNILYDMSVKGRKYEK